MIIYFVVYFLFKKNITRHFRLNFCNSKIGIDKGGGGRGVLFYSLGYSYCRGEEGGVGTKGIKEASADKSVTPKSYCIRFFLTNDERFNYIGSRVNLILSSVCI